MRRHFEMEEIEDSVASPTGLPAKQSKFGFLYVCLAVLFFSTSPIFIRWSKPFSSVEIAFWRLAIAALLVAIMGLITRQRLILKRRELPRFIFYGLVTAFHFIFYIASLSFTTIAHSLALAYTSPIFATLFSAFILHDPLPVRHFLGIVVAVVCIFIIACFVSSDSTCLLTVPCSR